MDGWGREREREREGRRESLLHAVNTEGRDGVDEEELSQVKSKLSSSSSPFLLLCISSCGGRSLLSCILLSCLDESLLHFQLRGKMRDESGERKVN